MVSMRFLMVLAVCLSSWSSLLLAATIEVTVDRDPVGLNESFQLIYEARGDVDDDPDFSVLIPHVDILSQSQSSNVSIINGNYSSSKTWTLQVMATEAGQLTLPPVSFGSDSSQSITLTITAAAAGPAAGQQGNDFFVELDLDASQVYVQQQLLLTQRIFSRQNLQAYAFGDLDFSGFDVVVQALGDEKQYKTRRGNVAYLVIEKRFALYPQSAGEFTIKPLLAEARTGSSSGSFFDPFGRNSQVVRARSNPYRVKVLAIPANVDMPVWIPARSLEITEQWQQQPPKMVVGEPLTRTLSVKAEGLTAAQIPVLPGLNHPALKQYPDQPMINDVTNDNGVTGYRIEKTAYIPTTEGVIELPAIEIPWWNTVTGRVEVARIAARRIDVVAAAGSSAVVQPSTVAPLIPEMTEPANTGDSQTRVETVIVEKTGPWKWLALIAFAGWFVTVVGAWLFYQKRSRLQSASKPSTLSIHSQSIKMALKNINRACQSSDASALRQAMLDWADTLWPQHADHTLVEIRSRLTPELATLLKQLDQSLYAADDTHQLTDDQFTKLGAGLKVFTEQTMGERQEQRVVSSAGRLEPLYR